MAYARATRETSTRAGWPFFTPLVGSGLYNPQRTRPVSRPHILYNTLHNTLQQLYSLQLYSSSQSTTSTPPLRHTHVRLRQTPAFQPRTTHMSRRVAHNANYPHTQLSRSAKTMNHCPCRRRLVPHSNRCHAPDKSCQGAKRKTETNLRAVSLSGMRMRSSALSAGGEKTGRQTNSG